MLIAWKPSGPESRKMQRLSFFGVGGSLNFWRGGCVQKVEPRRCSTYGVHKLQRVWNPSWMEESNQKSTVKIAVEYEMSEINESMGQDGRRKMCKIVNKPEEKRVESGKKVRRTHKKDPPDVVQTVLDFGKFRDSDGFLLRFVFCALHLFMSNNPPTPTFHPISILLTSLSSRLSIFPSHLLSSTPQSFSPSTHSSSLFPSSHSTSYPKTQLSLRSNQRETCLAVHPHDFFSSHDP